MTFQPVNIVQFIFVFQAGFGALLLFSQPRFRGLVYLLLLAMASMAFNLLEETGVTRDIYLITPIITLGKGPYFYLFIYFLVYPELKPKQHYLWHSLPMLFAIPFTQWPQLVIAFGSASQLVYGVLSLRLIQRYHRVIAGSRSDAHSLNINWILAVLIAFLVIGLLDLVRLNTQQLIPLTWNLAGQFVENATTLILFSILILKTFRHPHVYQGLATYENIVIREPLSSERQANYERLTSSERLTNSEQKKPETGSETGSETGTDSGTDSNTEQTLNDQASNNAVNLEEDLRASEKLHLKIIFEHLEQLISDENLHHQPRLSLNDLAQRSSFNPREISRAFNVVGKISFCDYINHLRVDDIKKELDQIENKANLLDIAFGVGFNSKSSFNAAFKRELGMTPSQYMKSKTAK